MFKVKQSFTKNYLLLLHIALFLVHFNSFEVICSQSLKVLKRYQNNQVPPIKKLFGVLNRFTKSTRAKAVVNILFKKRRFD